MSYSSDLMLKLFGAGSPLNQFEHNDSEYIYITIFVLTTTVAWFFFTSFFYDRSKDSFKEQVDEFFTDMKTPIDHVKEDITDQDVMQYRLVGIIALAFGAFSLLGMLIPNPLSGRLSFLFVGGIIFSIGACLFIISVKKKKAL